MKNKLISKQSNELLTYFNGKNQLCFDNNQAYQALPNSKMNTVRELLSDMSKRGLLMRVKEGVFYNGIDGYQIKIGNKDADNEVIRDILIYELKPGYQEFAIIRAESGKMKLSDDKRLLYFTLYKGIRYEELVENENYRARIPSTTTFFDEQKITSIKSLFSLLCPPYIFLTEQLWD
jgi:hypothetical protein